MSKGYIYINVESLDNGYIVNTHKVRSYAADIPGVIAIITDALNNPGTEQDDTTLAALTNTAPATPTPATVASTEVEG
jgi:hypothetical protein